MEELRYRLRLERRAQVWAWDDGATCESLGVTSGALAVAEERSMTAWATVAQHGAQCLGAEAGQARPWFKGGHLHPTCQGPGDAASGGRVKEEQEEQREPLPEGRRRERDRSRRRRKGNQRSRAPPRDLGTHTHTHAHGGY